MFGFYRIAAAVPILKVADVGYNRDQIIKLIKAADKKNASLVVFPELSVTAYTCGDLFLQNRLIEKAMDAVNFICASTKTLSIISIVGAPIRMNNALYNCAVIIQGGAIRGIVPKSFLPNYKEYYEKRWFASGKSISNTNITICDQTVSFGSDLLFQVNSELSIGIELCEDLWNVIPPSSNHAVAGATVIANLSASNELVTKADYRRDLVRQQSARCVSAYIYSSAGVSESSTDLLFSGHTMIAENGTILSETDRFESENIIEFADIDCQRLISTRINETSFSDNEVLPYRTIPLDGIKKLKRINRSFNQNPFVPDDMSERDKHCSDIINIQSSALAKRLSHINAKSAVIGISGGLDSTLALLVVHAAASKINFRSKNIIAVTMPGFGTSKSTYDNAVQLCTLLKVDFRQIDIKPACEQHFKDIGHDPTVTDITYENTQARERTQILMDLANKENGIVIGTGDLSEMALGWSTFNGDHMSMYAVNCSVPKTLVRYLIQWVAERSNAKLKQTLLNIIDTPISPELLPVSKTGSITQKTEEIVGPCELHDFFLYHFLKYGASPDKIAYLALLAFHKVYSRNEISKWLKIFMQRFFSRQFKRNCVPDGPKVGTISLSPRGDWRMPSDASSSEWITLRDELNHGKTGLGKGTYSVVLPK